ncbi:hypothetical protein Tco_0096969 [Tanacetum coccineum]
MLDEGDNWGIDPLEFISRVISSFENHMKVDGRSKKVLFHSWMNGSWNKRRMDNNILSNKEWKESDYRNPLNTTTDSFFKSHDERKIKEGNELRQMKHKGDNKDDEQPIKRVCKFEKFEAIKYLLGPNKEYIAVRRCEYNTWDKETKTFCQYGVFMYMIRRIQQTDPYLDTFYRFLDTAYSSLWIRRIGPRCRKSTMLGEYLQSGNLEVVESCNLKDVLIIEYLVKITVLTSNTSYPSRKIQYICACTSQKITKETRSIRSVMSSSTVTYTSVYSNSEPWRFQWVSDDELEVPEEAPQFPEQAPPSHDYVPGPEHPPSPDYVPGPEHPPSPDYVPGLEYPEYLVPSDAEAPIEDQPLPADASPTAISPGYVADSDPEEDPEEDPADYPADGGDEEEESSEDDADDEDE